MKGKMIKEEFDCAELKWNEAGLIPAILQDSLSGQVLMLGYMNREALELTLKKKEAVFWSRSRACIWHKGETSGNVQRVESIHLDCDADTLLVKVRPAGPTCHTGDISCFGEGSELLLDRLGGIIAQRKEKRPAGSYTTYLFDKGIDKILKKVGEESAEVIIAAKNEPLKELAEESADLLYHLFVLLEERNISYKEVFEVLKERGK